MTRVFSWESVSPRLLRAMIKAVYQADGHSDQNLVGRIPELKLATQAARSLGKLPKSELMPTLSPVLRDKWLPTLALKDLDFFASTVQLSLSEPARSATFRNRTELLAFLSARNDTETFRSNLRTAFVKAHKVENDVERSATGTVNPKQRPVTLAGFGTPEVRRPYDFQKDAWLQLDGLARQRSNRRGLLVLPTGSGKTFTAVHWALRRSLADQRTRILWIADQQELIDQAASTFDDLDQYLPEGFERTLRKIHGAAGSSSTVAHSDVDIVCATRQSLIGRGFGSKSRARLAKFLEDRGPGNLVIIDEAHHAVAPTYQKLIEFITETDPQATILGLTATPWPSGVGMAAKLRGLFPTTVGEVSINDLVKKGVLARPTFHTVNTEVRLQLEASEHKTMVSHDLPYSVLRKLGQTSRRDAMLVSVWLDKQEQWGKTLIFACNIDHAESLGRRFERAGVTPLILHSKTALTRERVLTEFRGKGGPCVLISVGMLNEGVDIPNATTAFIARPTTSRVLMRQMIGRVLRGPESGGEPIAHVVDMRDRWGADIDVLSPVDIPGLRGVVAVERETAFETATQLPDILLDELDGAGEGSVPVDVAARVQSSYEEDFDHLPYEDAMDCVTLDGWFELGDVNVPVFDHCHARWNELIREELMGGGVQGAAKIDVFDDLPIPRPTQHDVRDVVAFVRAFEQGPPFVEGRATTSPTLIANELAKNGNLTVGEQLAFVHGKYEGTLNRVSTASFEDFYVKVQRAFLALEFKMGVNPETINVPAEPPKKRLHKGHRDLPALFKYVCEQGADLLTREAPDLTPLLWSENRPLVAWTRHPVSGSLAYWAPRISGKSKGSPIIRVNLALNAPMTQVPDDLLEFLIWHELCHHVLPGRGHDAEFRRLECVWPNSVELEARLDALSEEYDFAAT